MHQHELIKALQNMNKKMKVTRYLGILFLMSLVFVSCSDRKHRRNKAVEVARLESYLDKAISNGDIAGYALDDEGFTRQDSAFRTTTQMYYVQRREGFGDSLVYGDVVSFRYESFYLDSTKVNGNYNAVNPQTLTLFTNITSSYEPADMQGFHEGISLMKNGGKATFFIPSTVGYGGNGANGVPGYTTLRVEVWITNVVPAEY